MIDRRRAGRPRKGRRLRRAWSVSSMAAVRAFDCRVSRSNWVSFYATATETAVSGRRVAASWRGFCGFLGNKVPPTRIYLPVESQKQKNRELSDGFERLLAIERVRDVPGPFSSGTTPAPSKGRGPMMSLWSSFQGEPRCQGRIADYSANTLPGHPLRL